MLKKIQKLFLAIALGFSLNSCETAMNLNELNADILLDQQYFIPIGSAYAKVSDALDSLELPQELSVVADTMYFTFKDSIIQELPDFDLSKSFPRKSVSLQPFNYLQSELSVFIPKDSVIPSKSFIIKIPVEIDPSLLDQQIDSIYFSSARIALQINSSQIQNLLPQNTKITLKFLKNLVFSDSTITQKVHYPSVFGKDEFIILNDFYIDCRDKSFEITMEVVIDFLQNRTQNITVNQNSAITFGVEVLEPKFRAVYGLFNFSDFNQEITENLVINDILPGTILKFADAKINLSTETNAGVNLVFNLDEIAITSKEGLNTKTNYADFNGSRQMSTYINTPTELFTIAHTEFKQINNNYGKLDQLFESDYSVSSLKLKYSFTKPPVSTWHKPEFITDKTYFKLKYQFKTPLYFNEGSKLNFKTHILGTKEIFEQIMLQDTIQRIGLVFDFENEFPLDFTLNMEFVDSRNVSKNNLLAKDPAFKATYIIEAPPVTEKGIVIKDSVSVQRLFVEFNKVNFETLKTVERINLILGMQTDVDKPMFFTTQDRVKVKLGAYVKGDYLIEL